MAERPSEKPERRPGDPLPPVRPNSPSDNLPEERDAPETAVAVTGEPAVDENAEHIWVRSARRDNRVVITERDPAHPEPYEEAGYGEVLIGGSRPKLAGKTPAIIALLRSGVLVEADGPDDRGKQKSSARPAPPRETEEEMLRLDVEPRRQQQNRR